MVVGVEVVGVKARGAQKFLKLLQEYLLLLPLVQLRPPGLQVSHLRVFLQQLRWALKLPEVVQQPR